MKPSQNIIHDLKTRHPYSWHIAALEVLESCNNDITCCDWSEFLPERLVLAAYCLYENGYLNECHEVIRNVPSKESYLEDIAYLELCLSGKKQTNGGMLNILFGIARGETTPGPASRRYQKCEQINAKVLEDWAGISAVSLCWKGESNETTLYESLPCLEDSSILKTGIEENEKPIIKEVFSKLAIFAREKGKSHFLFANTDVAITPIMLELISCYIRKGYECLGFTRTDVASLEDLDCSGWDMMHIGGIDAFLVSVDWWFDNQERFDDYIIGESDWDTVFCGIMAAYSKFYYFSHTRGVLLHEKHPQLWAGSPLSNYNIQLRDADDAIFYLLHKMYYEEARTHVLNNRSLLPFFRNKQLLRIFKGGKRLHNS